MLIRVECLCGTRFKFDLDDSLTRMPGAVQCPKCNKDCTSLADANLALQLEAEKSKIPEATPPARPSLSISAHPPSTQAATPAISVKPAPLLASPVGTAAPMASAPAPVKPPASGGTLRIGGTHSPTAAPQGPSTSTSKPASETPVNSSSPDEEYLCPKHPTQESVALCAVCNKRICPTCMESFGYVCSAYCQEQGKARKMNIPIFAGQRQAKMENVRKSDMGFLRAVGAGALLVILLLAFYNLYLAKPRSAYVLDGNNSSAFSATRWMNGETVVTLAGTHLAAHNSSSGKELWSADLPADKSDATAPKPTAPASKSTANIKAQIEESFFEDTSVRPDMMIRGADVWVVTPSKAVDYDLATGNKKKEVKWPQPAATIHLGSDTITAVARPDRTGTPLMRIDPSSGSVQTVLLPVNTAEIIAERRAMADRIGEPLRAVAMQNLIPREYGFRAVGGGLVQFKTRMLEQRLQEFVATIAGPTLIDKKAIRASQGFDAARELLNQNKREKTIDGSLYEVTVRRFFGGTDWTGQIIGSPGFHTTKSADIVIGGTNLVMLARAGGKLWETKLAYEIGGRFKSYGDDDEDFSNGSPVLEIGSRLLVADSGTIHCYDLKTGTVQWRLPTVGVKQMQSDGLGNIYVATTTASPESIKMEGESDLDNKDRPQILKIELATGKQLWQTTDLGDNVYVSGKFVYATRGRISTAARMHADNNLTEPVVNYRIHRLDASTGREKWEYHRQHAPQMIEVLDNHLLLTYQNQIQMLKFTSF